MKCPHCGSTKTRVLDTRVDTRTRQCGNCAQRFQTIEVLTVYAGRDRGWINDEPASPEAVSNQRPSKFDKFHPAQVDDELQGAAPELADALTLWWDESRWSKHKRNATWTRRAWLSNVNRVLAMHPDRALQLAQAGIEKGWQSLQDDYLPAQELPASALVPKNTAMQKAIEQWNL